MKLRVAISVVSISLITSAGPALAQPSATPTATAAKIDPAPEWTSRDWLLSSLAGSGAAGAAAFGLGFLGWQVDGRCFDSTEDCAPAVAALSIYSGLIFGASSAVTLYGSGRGFNGSFRAALLGAVIGNGASGLPIVLAGKVLGDDLGPPVVLAALVIGPAIGATVAFKISHRKRSRRVEEQAYGALIEVTGSRVSLGVPALSIGAPGGGFAAYAPIAAGTF